MAHIHWQHGNKELDDLLEIAAETLVGDRNEQHEHRMVKIYSSDTDPGCLVIEVTGKRKGIDSWSGFDAFTLLLDAQEFRLMLHRGMRDYDR